ncbi:MAG: PIG-L deacetylase family protein [Anaerolineae bacterium]
MLFELPAHSGVLFVKPSVSTTGERSPQDAAVIVAHPDDETLWAGGTILSHPAWNWHIVTLCRASDPDRAPKFFRLLSDLRATGRMGDLDDGPGQAPLREADVQQAIMKLLPARQFDLVISHSPTGEYTRHLRHEEVGRAVITLWDTGRLLARELWLFAYEDGGKRYDPRPIERASVYTVLPESIWQVKYRMITETYGFPPDGFEARTTPRAEAFWRFTAPSDARSWLDQGGGRT